MGAGASAGVRAAVEGANTDDLRVVIEQLGKEDREKLLAALGPTPEPASWIDYAMSPMFSAEEIDNFINKLPEETRAPLQGAEFAELCTQDFQKLDVNKNGALDGEELAAAVRQTIPESFQNHLRLDSDDVTGLILAFDANKNGKIELDEFTKFAKWVLAVHVCEGFIQT
mmetsp:Transcript_48810/g.136631  ORF Transcript_48810/g.136631 Transcript_48810/m.136631 type:complete len:170 (+) Transcript_48810:125-634(+)|eukprot:CAMPEP_0117499916 /NCGR_PEP_ID=MMETSP0784-20121206/22495_1 /TAXON_ID=39447 /ORGANISM="" /LENGTH=169 /DNA_ID=CAMNT_0005295085 /DNA_START=115 /DNA_END=624 /DNA_ORIENTATION=+